MTNTSDDLVERLADSQKACFDCGEHVSAMDIQAARAEIISLRSQLAAAEARERGYSKRLHRVEDNLADAEAERDAANERAEGYGRAYSKTMIECDAQVLASEAKLATATKALEEAIRVMPPAEQPRFREALRSIKEKP